MSIGKFAAGTTLATPAIGGVEYVTYEELTKDKSIEENSAATLTTTSTGTLTKENAGKESQDGKQAGRDVVITDPQSADVHANPNGKGEPKPEDESYAEDLLASPSLDS